MKSMRIWFLALTALLCLGVGAANAGLFSKCPPPPKQEVILQVCHPCTGCKYDVPVCIPCCCQGPPTACFHKTLFGNGKMVFEWACGHTVVVRFPACGGIRVID